MNWRFHSYMAAWDLTLIVQICLIEAVQFMEMEILSVHFLQIATVQNREEMATARTWQHERLSTVPSAFCSPIPSAPPCPLTAVLLAAHFPSSPRFALTLRASLHRGHQAAAIGPRCVAAQDWRATWWTRQAATRTGALSANARDTAVAQEMPKYYVVQLRTVVPPRRRQQQAACRVRSCPWGQWRKEQASRPLFLHSEQISRGKELSANLGVSLPLYRVLSLPAFFRFLVSASSTWYQIFWL
jgi:hypothetical protein